jgi:hypothetical protein
MNKVDRNEQGHDRKRKSSEAPNLETVVFAGSDREIAA